MSVSVFSVSVSFHDNYFITLLFFKLLNVNEKRLCLNYVFRIKLKVRNRNMFRNPAKTQGSI